MSLVPIEQIGQIGIIKDTPSYSIPPNAWSDGNNVRFTDTGVQNIDGYIEVMENCPIFVKHLVFYNQVYREDYWLAFGVTKTFRSNVGQIWCWNANMEDKWVEVTPEGGLTDSPDLVWSTTFLGAQLLATNGDDPLITWPLDPVTNEPVHDNKFEVVEIAKPDTDTSVSPKTIDAFRSFLIGMNWSGDPDSPTRVWWSTPGGHYAPLPSWDYMDETKDAGDYELNDTQGGVIDGAPLGDAFVIYKEDSVYIANYVGPPFIFGFKTLSKDVGLLTKNALEEYPGGHIFLSKYDVHITDGQQVKSLLTDKLQGELFNNLSGDNYHKSFIASDVVNSEMLICWPSANSEWCDKCIVWNWDTGALGLRDIPQLSHIRDGVAELTDSGDTWDEVIPTWDTISRAWGGRAFESVLPELVFASYGDDMIYRSGVTHQMNGEDMYTSVERTGIDLGDPGSVKRVNAVWPRISTDGDNTVDVYVSSQMSPNDPVSWKGPFPFSPNHQSKVSCIVTGKYVGWKIVSDGNFKWQCHGVEFNVEPAGQRGSRVL